MSADSSPDRPPAIRVDGLRKTFGDGDSVVTAVDDVSFEIESGALVGLLGPNGAGKTTMIKSMLGLVLPDGGTVEIGGVDVHERPAAAYARVGAILEGARNVYWRLTVRENLRFFAGIGGRNPSDVRDRHDDLLEQFDLTDRANTPVMELSRGMKQKVSLASTLARDVDVVFMDEPTLGLDVEASLELRSELGRLSDREEVTIVISSHDMDVIEDVCDRVIVLNDGSVVEYSEVDDLLEVFGTRQFRIALDEPLPESACRRLERAVDAECIDGEHRFTVAFRAVDGDALYKVMDVLRGIDPEIREFETVQPDLEGIFLELTETNPGVTAAQPRSGRDEQQRAVAHTSGTSTEGLPDGHD